MLYPTIECVRRCAQCPSTDKHSRRQRQKQLQSIVNPDVEERVDISLHSSDIHRRKQGTQPRSVVIELLVVDPPEEVNCVVHEMWDPRRVLVQKGK